MKSPQKTTILSGAKRLYRQFLPVYEARNTEFQTECAQTQGQDCSPGESGLCPSTELCSDGLGFAKSELV